MVVEVEPGGRHSLIPLFANCRHDRVLIDSVLEGHFGRAYADSADGPAVARLDSGAFTMLGGNPRAAGVRDLLRVASVHYVTPQTAEWRATLEGEFGPWLSTLPFVEFSAAALDRAHLLAFSRALPAGFELRCVDQALAERLPADLGNDGFLECFHSIADFLKRGIGYCVVCQGRIVSAATSMARSLWAIDIEIETAPGYRRRGLATAVGARLVVQCLEWGIKPCWLAANAASEGLARKLGYVRGSRYETLAIDEP